MREIIKIIKALGDRNRLRIVKMLEHRSLCVCEITAVLELATSTVSQHLSILKEAGIIKEIKVGKWVDHQLNMNILTSDLIGLIEQWLNDDAQIISDREKLKTTHREDICGS